MPVEVEELLTRGGMLSVEQAERFLSVISNYEIVRATEAQTFYMNITYPILQKRLSEASFVFRRINGSGDYRTLSFTHFLVSCQLVAGNPTTLTLFYTDSASSPSDYDRIMDYVARPEPDTLAVAVSSMYLSLIHKQLPDPSELRVKEYMKHTLIQIKWAKRSWIQMKYQDGVLYTDHPAAHRILHAIKVRDMPRTATRTVMI